MSRMLVFVLLAGLISVAAAEVKVTWQFRQGQTNVVGPQLEATLGSPVVQFGTPIRFVWDESVIHGLYLVNSQSDYDSCNVNNGVVKQTLTERANLTITLPEGTNYLIDNAFTNCDFGLKMIITVLPQGQTTTAPTTTTAPLLTAPEKTPDDAFDITWHFGTEQAPIQIEADDFLRFQWNQGVNIALKKVSREAYESCSATSDGEILQEPVTTGDVLVPNLSVGKHYFISYLPTHCTSGKMKIEVNVVPQKITYEVSVWPDELSEDSTGEVFITFIGNDEAQRLWISPSSTLNTDPYNPSQDLVTLASDHMTTVSVVTRDVGIVSGVRLQSASSQGFIASTLRVMRTDEKYQSTTFQCTSMVEDAETGASTGEQFCTTLVEPPVIENIFNATNTEKPAECSCFRQVHHHIPDGRVLSCTSDGCFSTIDTAEAGWSDVPQIKRLLGTGQDDLLYGLDADNTTMMSRDAGVTWTPVDNPPAITSTALEYSIDITYLSHVPLDQHRFTSTNGQVDWGPTFQGLSINTDGSWRLEAAWACRCDGTCGQKCDQDYLF